MDHLPECSILAAKAIGDQGFPGLPRIIVTSIAAPSRSSESGNTATPPAPAISLILSASGFWAASAR